VAHGRMPLPKHVQNYNAFSAAGCVLTGTGNFRRLPCLVDTSV